ncbi:flagellar basal body-associated FliL family protein [Spirochaeta thermophila]|uniref:Flagellar protein FliL n=2 Tax=Winmispira thermophila TaxID=154 RepID=G0GCD6_WINT7|nr:flagellar basal body-associated FliL family protein [Spirochaeta thermophila]ADN01869.1 flagellar protein [Spirochaeta thermophila DSM 6192]AEJ61221.1 flagellar basal body-associated protein FliL [Spirochaeta thermophila DSM 6578]
MSDIFDDETQEPGAVEAESKQVGFLPSIVIQILKYVALGLLATVFVVTVVIITLRVLNVSSQSQNPPEISPEYQAAPPVLAWYEIGEIRARTSDEAQYTLLAVVYLGYKVNDKALQTELNERRPYLRDLIRRFFSSKRAEELRPQYEEMIKEELKAKINDVLTSGMVQDIVFDTFTLVEF